MMFWFGDLETERIKYILLLKNSKAFTEGRQRMEVMCGYVFCLLCLWRSLKLLLQEEEECIERFR